MTGEHYSALLSLNFIRAFLGKPILLYQNTTPEDTTNLKIVNAYATDGGHHMSFKYKDKLYAMDINVFEPKTMSVSTLLMAEDVITKGGFDG